MIHLVSDTVIHTTSVYLEVHRFCEVISHADLCEFNELIDYLFKISIFMVTGFLKSNRVW